eukprot:537028-Amorphochlora_amoeboformis.AAC.2
MKFFRGKAIRIGTEDVWFSCRLIGRDLRRTGVDTRNADAMRVEIHRSFRNGFPQSLHPIN